MHQSSDIPKNGVSSPTQEPLKLLVVDDELDNLQLLHRTFRRSYQVYRARSGQEALDCLAAHGEMAIIISDQRMPKMNGTEFLSLTVKDYPDTMRIVLTGYTDAEDMVEAINSGQVHKYITKPWKSKELRQVVDEAADTYRVVKQRTNALLASLKQVSLHNSITTTIRRSLDYASTLQTVVESLGKAFEADYAVLYPADSIEPGQRPQPIIYTKAGAGPMETLTSAHVPDQTMTLDAFIHGDCAFKRLASEFSYREQPLASIVLYQLDNTWDATTIDLLKSITEQVVLAISQAKLYHDVQRQTEQMQAELQVARQIQQKLLNQVWPDIPNVKIQAQYHAAREVSGDFYEVLIHPQGDIWLAVGDVSGKGVPAALFMASAISLLRRELSISNPATPNEVMANLNHSLNADLVNSNHFITMALVRYRPATRELVYANAGHVYPILWSHKKIIEGSQPVPNPAYLKGGRGVPLGVLPHWQSNAGCLHLTEGDALMLISDGITEARLMANGQETMLKEDGLWHLILEQTDGLDLQRLLEKLNAISQEQHDDQTILSLEVL